jgi:uncharacterized membrane protein
MPVVRSIYNALKQIAETVFHKSNTSFQQACLIEYPRKGIWAIGFVASSARGEILTKAGETEMVNIFLPTTPNPTSGYLLFVPRRDVTMLDMTIEEAAKLIISGGMVQPVEAKPAAAPGGGQPAVAKAPARA